MVTAGRAPSLPGVPCVAWERAPRRRARQRRTWPTPPHPPPPPTRPAGGHLRPLQGRPHVCDGREPGWVAGWALSRGRGGSPCAALWRTRGQGHCSSSSSSRAAACRAHPHPNRLYCLYRRQVRLQDDCGVQRLLHGAPPRFQPGPRRHHPFPARAAAALRRSPSPPTHPPTPPHTHARTSLVPSSPPRPTPQTNCLAPLAKVVDDNFGIKEGARPPARPPWGRAACCLPPSPLGTH